MKTSFFRSLGLPWKTSRLKGAEIIRKHFHTEFYLLAYPDVYASGADPVEHYLATGWKTGYDPCPWFSSRSYLETHPDVAEANVNPFVHYCLHGHAEGREISASLSAAAARFSDSSPFSAAPAPAPASPAAPVSRQDMLAKQKLVIAPEFDTAFYRASYPDLYPLTDDQLIDHFNEHGWREWRNPCAWFSTEYYLTRYRDIREGGLNPFYHYLAFGRAEARLPNHYCNVKRFTGFQPSVSAIVPNFNHARFLERRIKSIAEQDWQPRELIILDDASTDNSREVIEELVKDLPFPVRMEFNETNSGNVFRQWAKGVSLASGDLLWICESDDFCDSNFLSILAPCFADPSVMIAFGAIQFSDAEGAYLPGLDGYRESAARGYWSKPRVESANTWFNGPFGLRNVIANVGGCVIRRQPVEPALWSEAQSYAVCGDWYLYMQLARGGRIAFDPRAVAYFRQHSANTSVSNFEKLSFYKEHFRIAFEARRRFGISDTQTCKFYRIVREHFLRHFPEQDKPLLHGVFNLNALIDQRKELRHILIVILSFSTGGGEIFPINLANALADRGYIVSVMTLMSEGENPEIRARLSSRIAVYERELVDETGLMAFLETHGIDLVHTHFAGADLYIHTAVARLGLPYVVTHHGSYEVTDIPAETLKSLINCVDHWVYIAEKNIEKFRQFDIDRSAFTKLPNAVPVSSAGFPYTRESLGIEENAFVFGLASRALKSKGWHIAIEALSLIKKEAKQPLYLLICGEGPDYLELHSLYSKTEGVKFLGYQREIMAFYRLCDCCLLPTRFPGESYPLTLIEAIEAERPVIATGIGEIKEIIGSGSAAAGITLPYAEDDETFTRIVAEAMERMLDEEQRAKFIEGVREMKKAYDFDLLVSRYEEIYRKAAKWDK